MTTSHPTQMDRQSGRGSGEMSDSKADSKAGLCVGRPSSEGLPPAPRKRVSVTELDVGYTINGKPATRERAHAHWMKSASYASAKRSTRHHIWRDAHSADGGQWGEINWLNEAGIQIVPLGESAGAQPSNEKAVDAFAALLASHQRLAEALTAIESRPNSDALSVVTARAALASIPKEPT